MLDNETKLELNKLFLELMEGCISDSRLLMLDEYLRHGPEVQDYYCEFMLGQVSMNKVFGFMASVDTFAVFSGTDPENDDFVDLDDVIKSGSKVADDSNVSLRGVDLEGFTLDVDQADVEDNENTLAMLELLKMEQTSPAVIIPKEEPPRELIEKVESDFKWFPGEGNKSLTRAYLILAASIMVFFGYVYFFVPAPVDRPVVANLADSIDAVWDDDLQVPDDFDNSMVQSRYRLKKGYASILFNSGAKVTVEAPCELSLNSVGDMKLYSGKIYAIVCERAQGFTVMAGDNKIVDLGTEFGVEVDTSNNTQLHVTKGRTLLYSGPKDSAKKKKAVDAGQARKIYNDGFVKHIDVAERAFVRHIDSKTGIVFKGEFMPGKKKFVAYHDLGATAGHESTGNVTTHLVGSDELAWGLDESGKELINYLDGLPTGVSIIIDNANGLDSREDGYIRPPALGTPAYSLFNVPGLNLNNGMIRVGNKGPDYPGNYTEMTLTLKGLNPEMLYDLALYGDRDRSVAYNEGVERFSLSGAKSAINASSTGIIDNLTTDMETLNNADGGHVVRWSRIAPGADGTITVKVDAGFYGKVTNIAYLSAIRLEAVYAGSNR